MFGSIRGKATKIGSKSVTMKQPEFVNSPLFPKELNASFFLNFPIIVQCRFSRLFYWRPSICTGDNLDKVGGREKAENKWHCYQGRGGCRGLLSIAQSREEPSNMFYLLSIFKFDLLLLLSPKRNPPTFFYCLSFSNLTFYLLHSPESNLPTCFNFYQFQI